MKMRKVLVLLLALVLAVGCLACFTACGGEDEFMVGFICLHDENSSYDKNFIEAAKSACDASGVKYKIVTGIPESDECYQAAKDLVDQGCDVIFADSFGHEDYMIKAAREFTNVEFCHATGVKAKETNLANYHNAFASIYEGRYLAGIAAGLKLNKMIADKTITADQAVMGYIGAFTYAEVISGYSSFYLGAKSVCPSVTMKVKFTGSWYTVTGEASVCEDLINAGCVLISQHADSMGAPAKCAQKGNIPNVFYNGTTISEYPGSYLVASKINWAPYFNYMIEQAQKGEAIATDWCGTLAGGSVVVLDVNTTIAADGTVEAIEAAKTELLNGTRKVFDVDKFTIDGNKLSTSTAKYGQYVKTEGGITYFSESDTAIATSAPYFDLEIDGITILGEKVFSEIKWDE